MIVCCLFTEWVKVSELSLLPGFVKKKGFIFYLKLEREWYRYLLPFLWSSRMEKEKVREGTWSGLREHARMCVCCRGCGALGKISMRELHLLEVSSLNLLKLVPGFVYILVLAWASGMSMAKSNFLFAATVCWVKKVSYPLEWELPL